MQFGDMCVCVCVCVCVCEQTEGDVLAGSFQTQAASTISQLMICNSKTEFGSPKQDTQTNSSPYKTQRDARSSLPWHETSLQLHSTSCSTERLRKGRIKMRHLKTGPRNIRSSQSFHTGAVCWRWSRAFFSSLNPSELHTDTDKAVTMLLLLFCP